MDSIGFILLIVGLATGNGTLAFVGFLLWILG
jgi:hypothetical protein